MADGGSSLSDIGRRITMLREALGHNQVNFARLVDITQPALNNYENGLRRPDLDQAFKMVRKTGVTLDWLYLGDRSGLPQRLLAQLAEFDSRERQAG